jgi:hypothetical protein
MTWPEDAEAMLAGLDQPDRDLAVKAYTEWARKVLNEPGVDLSAMPERAFLAGFAYATQFRWE